jgi:uncharacterized DUF497 family protein
MIDWNGLPDSRGTEECPQVRRQTRRQPERSRAGVFNEPLLMAPDLRHSFSEQRIHALGRTDDGRLLHITFTLRANETTIRVISARDMSRKERSYYEQEA